MPLRKARIRRSKWFDAVVAALEARQFQRSPSPSGITSPRFYFFSRGGFTVQILPDHRLRISRLSGRITEDLIQNSRMLALVLDALTLDVEFGED